MIEVWKDIEGYEGFYQISNLGRVKRLDTYVHTGISGVERRLVKGRILSLNSKERYKRVRLSKEGIGHSYLVHRLVAEAFIPNHGKYEEVNHKDEDPSNNVVWLNEDGSVDYEKSNLEWCTHSYNMNWKDLMKRAGQKRLKSEEDKRKRRQEYLESTKEKRKEQAHRRYIERRVLKGTTTKKMVAQYDRNGNFIGVYSSITEASEKTGISHIGCACAGKRKTAGNYIWKFRYGKED